ncbi:hypothetical protein DH2020_025351 [Rehmannia glutinosa]|uniref:NB-ARC domain-containing protein n=1 Tax=Rehmannia glutinosa TaxID=99300 RepID=A0ABR0W1P4_REHGL
MAYTAVVSLRQTIHRLLNISRVSIILPCSLETLNSAYKEVRSILRLFKELDERSGLVDKNRSDDEFKFTKMRRLRNYDIFRDKRRRSRRMGFRGYGQRMKSLDGKVRVAACKLEDSLETHFVNLNNEEHHPSSLTSLDLEELIKQDVNSFIKTLKELEGYMKEEELEDDDDDDVVSSRIDFGGNKSKMVGFSDEFRQIKDLLHGDDKSVNFVSLVGMAGLGKTTLAEELFEDSSILEWFDHRVWVTVGPRYQFKDIVQSILSQVNPNVGEILVQGYELDNKIRECLEGRRCLIVVDDVWDVEITRHMKHLIMLANVGSRDKLGSLILLTTRQEKVGMDDTGERRRPEIHMLKLRFVTKEESWDLLRDKLFGEQSCPPQLEKAGKQIAENCDGLPLTIVTVAELLSKVDDMTPEYWNKVANKENSIFIDAYDQMSKVILRSYNYLPQYLKACFLYIGNFPQKYDILFSKLTMLWTAEECFLPESKYFIKLQVFLLQHLDELIGKSLVLVRQRSYNHKPKTYGLHSALWHSCMREAERNKFFHVLNNYADSLITESIRNQRRLCIHNNILFGLKDVHKSMESISTVRSLLCTGPHHQYPVPVCFGLRLLRVIHALTIRFYEFPVVELMKLVLLRYLALTYDGKLPPSISKLWNLQFFIVRRHLSIVNLYEDELYLPMEIWDMKELKHLQIMGSDLPSSCDGALLPNLLTLADVSARSCTKLSLSGLGYQWEDMKVIASLPNLRVLKLRCYAFQGPKWDTHEMGFPLLEFLLIEDTDLVNWTVERGSFSKLQCLNLKHCYKLQEIPRKFRGSLTSIEIFDCNPLIVTCAKEMQKNRSNMEVNAHSSWDDGKLKA